MPSFSDARVVCRPALPADTDDVLAFTKQIWDGRDYIHLVWDEWLADPNGILVSAQLGAHVVGIAKVTPVFSKQWWLHGLRVKPEYQGQKIGSHLHEYTNEWWLEHGDGTIRLLTSTRRLQVQHLCERTGYLRVGEIMTYRRVLKPEAIRMGGKEIAESPFAPVSSEDVSKALAFARKNLPHIGGLMDTGWRFVLPDEASVQDRQNEGHLHWWRGGDGLLATWEGDDDDGPVLGIGFAAVREPALLSEMLRATPSLADGIRAEAIFWLAPREPAVEQALQEAGFVTDDDSGVLFERRHPRP